MNVKIDYNSIKDTGEPLKLLPRRRNPDDDEDEDISFNDEDDDEYNSEDDDDENDESDPEADEQKGAIPSKVSSNIVKGRRKISGHNDVGDGDGDGDSVGSDDDASDIYSRSSGDEVEGNERDENGDGDESKKDSGEHDDDSQFENDDDDDDDASDKHLDDDDGDDDDDDDNDIDDSSYRKINEDFRKNYITETHPEAKSHTDDEIHAMARVVRNKAGTIVDPLHKTVPILTKYEKTRILGIRTKQLNNGAEPFISSKINITPEKIIDGYPIALRELEEKKLPFIIRRPLPSGGVEYWYLQDLEVL